MQRDVTLNFLSLIFDCDHNFIILFLILLRIWGIGVDVKLTQQDVKNLRLHMLDEDKTGKSVNATLYQGRIGSLLYLTTCRPDI